MHKFRALAAVVLFGLASQGALATTLTEVDVNTPTSSGSVAYNPNNASYTLTGTNDYGWVGTIDYVPLTGDFDVSAEVTAVSNNPYTGLIALNSLDPKSLLASVRLLDASSVPGTVGYAYVASDGGPTFTGGSLAGMSWLRLTRSGNSFSEYASADGAAWTLVANETLSMGSTVDVGLYLNSDGDTDGNQTSTATFSQLTGFGLTSSLGSASVPEPTAAGLLTFALLGAAALRRKPADSFSA